MTTTETPPPADITTEAELTAAYQRVARRRDIVYGTMPAGLPNVSALWAAYFRRHAAIDRQFAVLFDRAAALLPADSFASRAAGDAADGWRLKAQADEQAAADCGGEATR